MGAEILHQFKQNLFVRAFRIFVNCYNATLNFLFYLPCGGEKACRARCVKFAGLATKDRVLDLYCGTGTLTAVIAGKELAEDLVGVDISEQAIEIKPALLTRRRKSHND